jgi:hypothetical protein
MPSRETTDATTTANKTCSVSLAEADRCNAICEETSQTDKGTVVETPNGGTTGQEEKLKEMDVAANDSHSQSRVGNNSPKEGEATSQPTKLESSSKERPRSDSQESNSKRSKGDKPSTRRPAPDAGNGNKASHSSSSVYKKVWPATHFNVPLDMYFSRS